MDEELNEYYKYLMRQHNEILTKLMTIKYDIHTAKVYKQWLDQAIDYLKEVYNV